MPNKDKIMQDFFMTYSGQNRGKIVPYIEENQVPIMRNGIDFWSKTGGFRDMDGIDTKKIIDSGGFNVMDNYGTKFPWEVEEYHTWLDRHKDQFEWAAVMDYACEERFDDLFDKQERMEMTISNTIEHFDKNPDYKVLPVLQGRSYEDYLWSIDKLVEFGIPVDHVGLGTVCRLSNSKKIVELEEKIRENTPVETIHGFGVKINAFKQNAMFETADSAAWNYAPSFGNAQIYNEDTNQLETYDYSDDSYEALFVTFKNYYQYVSKLHEMSIKRRKVFERSDMVI